MAPMEYSLPGLGLLLELVILWRCAQARLWQQYPFFYVYLGYIFARTIAIFVVTQFQFPAYAVAYWLTAAAADLLRFLVAWEVFRQSFAFAVAARRIVGQVLFLLLIVLTAVLFLGTKSPGLFFADFERKSSFIQATMVVVTLALARYYSLPLGRNIWGMALGLGMYVSMAIVNFAALELVKSFFPYWRFIRPLSFIGMLGVWAWALWSYAPNPRPATAALEVYERGLAHWAQAWSDVRAALRKAVGL